MSSSDAKRIVPRDPLTTFREVLARHGRPPAEARAEEQRRFNSGEHVWLGARGVVRALGILRREHAIEIDRRLFTDIRRREGDMTFDYGELVALSGDFYETPEDLFEEKPSFASWLYEETDIDDLREVFGEELAWIEQNHHERGGPYPEANIRLAWNAKAYVELALRNVDHFGWHNVVAYCRHHAAALALAVEAGGRNDETFRRALFTNAFADHFLTDAFSAGHVRVPRAQIITWAAAEGLGEKVAGSLSKLLHDQDGHIDVSSLHGGHDELTRDDDEGLHVQSSLGDTWYCRCDGQLFLDAGAPGSLAVKQPVAAVADSLQELILAWKTGEPPRGVYQATRHAPFPHADAPHLVTKFPGDISQAELERLWKGVALYAKLPWISGLERAHIRSLFVALPSIMTAFRKDVARAAEDAELVRRIAPGYVEAFGRIA